MKPRDRKSSQTACPLFSSCIRVFIAVPRVPLVVRFQHSHPGSAYSHANVGIKGPRARITFEWSFGFDIRFGSRGQAGSEYQIRSTRALASVSKGSSDEISHIAGP